MRLRTALLFVGFGFAVVGAATKQMVNGFETEVVDGPVPWTHLRPANDPQEFQFAILADRTGGHRAGVFEDAVRKLNLLRPEFVLCVGDLIEGYTTDTALLKRQWDEFDMEAKKLEMPFFHVPGNHDISNPVQAQEWQMRFGRPYYHFRYRDVLFLVLNSEDPVGRMSDDQIAYFARVLRANRDARWTFAFMHQPLWVADGTLYDPSQYKNSQWSKFEKLIEGRPHTVIAGHLHQYASEERKDGKYLILATSGGGSDLRGARNYGELDHVTWLTMRDRGPQIANLELKGIYDENLRTRATARTVQRLLIRGVAARTVRVDNGLFTSATTRITTTNDAEFPMKLSVDLAGSAPLSVDPLRIVRELAPGSDLSETITLTAASQLDVAQLSAPLSLKWSATLQPPGEQRIEVEGAATIGIEGHCGVPATTSPISVDARLDDWRNLPFSFAWSDPADASFKFGAMHDGKYLYLAARTTDDRLALDPAKYPWDQDAVEFRLDARPDPQRSWGRGDQDFVNCLPVILAPGPDGTPIVFQKEKLPAGTLVACARADGGTAAEVAIPVAWLKAQQGGDWTAIRLNVAMHDIDDFAAPAGKHLWWRPDWRGPTTYEGSGTFIRE